MLKSLRDRTILVAICAVVFSADSLPGVLAGDQNSLKLNVDTAQFRGDSLYARLEIYQSVSREGLNYKKLGPHGFVARYRLETMILQDDSVMIQHQITEADTVRSLEQISSRQQFIYTNPFFLKPGQYQIRSRLQDQNDNRRASNIVPVTISLYKSDSLIMSDIQFATKIGKAVDPYNPFVKNNLQIMPNPETLYGEGLENIAFYAELYNLLIPKKGTGTYKVDYIIENDTGKVISRIPGRKRRKSGQHAAIYTSFDISSLTSGRYRLKIDAIDNELDRHALSSKSFSIYRKRDAIAFLAEQERKVYKEFDDAALQNYFNQIAYIATDQEKKVFKELNMTGKREFLVRFWADRDPNPDTPGNEFKEDYIQRLLKTKIHFSSAEVDGWKTDRGRILLTYGTPDFIEREPALPAQNANEVWHYENLQGPCIFVFIDMDENGKFRLVHSNYRDEMSNPDWKSYLYK